MNDRWLVEFSAYDVTNAILTTQYFDSGTGFVTSGTDTPPHQYYDARLKVPGNISRSMFAGGTTRGASRVGFGDIVLLNGDGGLDYLLDYGLDGRICTIKRTESIKQNPTYSDFSTFAVVVMDQPEIEPDAIRIRIKDYRFSLNVPLQPTKFAGSGLGTLEGGDDLKDKPKPIVYGSPKNVTPVPVETSKLIYQVADKQLSSIATVYDRGLPLYVGLTWTAQTSGFGVNTVWGAAYGAGLFVIVGNSGNLATSPDGITWTSRTSTFGATRIKKVAYGNGLFVAVGYAGKMATSPDGITWTSRTSGFGATDIWTVEYSADLGLWILGGDSATMKTASDPTNNSWSTPSTGFTGTQIIKCVRWANGLLVAGSGTGGGSGGNELRTSPDGTTWTLRTIPFADGEDVLGADFGNGTWVISGNNGELATSPDAITWTSRTAAVTLTAKVFTVRYGNGLFLVGDDTGNLATSTDGFLWIKRDSGTGGGAITESAYGNGVFVITADVGIVTSTAISAGTYASSADLLDDSLAPAPGTYKVFLDSTGSYFRLGATPAGQITCDPVEGANAAARTAGQIYTKLLTRAGLTAYAADVTALDTANSSELGFYQGPDETTYADVIDEILGSVGASWYIDASGNFRAVQFTGPAATSVLSLTENDILEQPERIVTADPGRGLPIWRATVRWGKNYTVQTSDLAAAVTTDRRTFLAQEYRDAKDSDSAVQTAHLLAPEFVQESLMVAQANATTEATRLLTLRKTRKDRLRLVVPLRDETLVADLATTIAFTSDRVGGTHRYVVLQADAVTDADPKRLELQVWGPE